MALVVGWIGLSGSTIALADHPKPWHLDSIHLAYDDEDFCVNSTGSDTPSRWSTAYTNAANALWGNSNSSLEFDAKGWDSAYSNWRIWFVGASDACQNLSPGVRGPIEIEMWIEDDTRSGTQYGGLCPDPSPPNPDTSCAIADNLLYSINGHDNYEFYYLNLYDEYALGDASADGQANFAYHQINHEMGHALGLADGTGDCPSSVMHSVAYGCTSNLRYPSSADISEITGIALGH